ncbi:MAG: lysine--tRNA ligase [Patescibacteria group bacterium]|nr:lysine--tRNA ligase [Patescibacteria group bacterium]
MPNKTDERQDRLDRRQKLIEAGIQPHPAKFDRSHLLFELKGLAEGEEVSVCGRIMLQRVIGKLAFYQLQDASGTHQVGVKIDDVGEDNYKLVDLLDRGDFLGVEGVLGTTKTNEPTVWATSLKLLGKAISPLPEKWHGVQDIEKIYRHRELDLITNRESFARFKLRSTFMSNCRQYLESNGFVEVETPILTTVATGAAAKPFKTHHETDDMDMVLRISPETYLKRLIGGGFDRVFETSKCFRNEGSDPSHVQEFTQIEYYVAYQDYLWNMEFTENFLREVLAKTFDKLEFDVIGKTGSTHHIDMAQKIPRYKLTDLIKEKTGIDVLAFSEAKDLLKTIKAKKIEIEDADKKGLGTLIDELYKKFVRPELISPCFIIKHTTEMKPLARRCEDEPRLVESFQLIIAGWEVLNAYSELVDPIDQRERMKLQAEFRKMGDEESFELDEDFLQAMETGFPPITGWGMGIDRIFALLTGQPNLRDVILFPIMKPENA